MTINESLRYITTHLTSHYPTPTAALQAAWLILEHVTKRSRTQLLTQANDLTSEHELAITNILHTITVEHTPLDYILGTVHFLELTLTVTPPILIPRPETEWWCSELIKKLSEATLRPHHILDIGTGSGCLALSLGKAFKQSKILAVDINKNALELARFNREKNQAFNVKFGQSNVFEAVQNHPPFNLIVSNPPYIAETDWEKLEPSVKRWEDKGALVARNNGYELIEKIITQAPNYLAPNGQLWIEIGADQGQQVVHLFTQRGFKEVTLWQDLYGRDRVVFGQWKE